MTGQRVNACEIGRAPQLLEGLALRGKRNNAAGRPQRDKRPQYGYAPGGSDSTAAIELEMDLQEMGLVDD